MRAGVGKPSRPRWHPLSKHRWQEGGEALLQACLPLGSPSWEQRDPPWELQACGPPCRCPQACREDPREGCRPLASGPPWEVPHLEAPQGLDHRWACLLPACPPAACPMGDHLDDRPSSQKAQHGSPSLGSGLVAPGSTSMSLFVSRLGCLRSRLLPCWLLAALAAAEHVLHCEHTVWQLPRKLCGESLANCCWSAC